MMSDGMHAVFPVGTIVIGEVRPIGFRISGHEPLPLEGSAASWQSDIWAPHRTL